MSRLVTREPRLVYGCRDPINPSSLSFVCECSRQALHLGLKLTRCLGYSFRACFVLRSTLRRLRRLNASEEVDMNAAICAGISRCQSAYGSMQCQQRLPLRPLKLRLQVHPGMSHAKTLWCVCEPRPALTVTFSVRGPTIAIRLLVRACPPIILATADCAPQRIAEDDSSAASRDANAAQHSEEEAETLRADRTAEASTSAGALLHVGQLRTVARHPSTVAQCAAPPA